MAPATATTVRDTLDDGELQAAWQGAGAGGPAPAAPIHRAQHTIEIAAVPGEHVRLQCSNAMPPAGWLMMIFLHVTALRVRLERE